jgi:gamma-glutamyltranspeptidase/glutathione hydrolase
MVATAHWRATEAAAQVLTEGGNAIDAAVTAAFALSVCEPQASGLGGQTMMLVHTAEPRKTFALDGSSRAPHRALPQSLNKQQRRHGHRAATVPSTPAVLRYALETYGTLRRERVLEPAIGLAEHGYEVTPLQSSLQRRESRLLRRHGAGALFLRDGSRPWRPGSVLRQPALAATLRRMAEAGIADFYTGETAARIHSDMQANGGLIHLDDLAQIPRPIERRPVATRFGNLRVVTFPPPGAGRVLVEMLHLLEQFPEDLWDPDSPRGAVLLAEVMRRAALDRRDRPYDPAFYPQVGNKRMLSQDYARTAAARIRQDISTPGETTHLSVMDRLGNAVALTQSIDGVFGSCATAPDLGFVYNNYMNAFEYEDITHPYYMRPNAVPWASVAPTLVFRGQRPWLAIGSTGSERIVTTVLQVLLRLPRQSPFNAVEAPRLHCSVDGRVSLEAPRFRDDVEQALRAQGFEIDTREDYSFYMGCVALVQRDASGFSGVADPRRDGSARGPSR